MLKTISTSNGFLKESKLSTKDSQDCMFITKCLETNISHKNNSTLDCRNISLLDNTNSTESSKSCCSCGQEFDCSNGLVRISSRNIQDPDYCQGCKKLFSLAKKPDIIQRFNDSLNSGNSHEDRFLRDWYLHKCTSTTFTRELYHLPLSTHYYSKRTDKAEFTFDGSLPDKNTIAHYSTCTGCADFVKTKRGTLRLATIKKTVGKYVASVEELFEFLVNSSSTCVFTGMQGSWAPFPVKPTGVLDKNWVRDHFVKNTLFILSLDHIIPLSGGGSSDVGNLQVTLQFLNSVKGNYESDEFHEWLEAFKQHQGYL